MNDPAKAQQRAADPPNGPVPAVPDERDVAIARLERALVEERENAAGLRKTNDELRFKAQILEKGYATQLADARTRMEAAQKELADLKAQKAALGGGGEDTLRLLSDTRAELARVTMDRDQLRAQLARREGRTAVVDPASDEKSGTINALIAGVSALRERPPAAPSSHLHAQVRAEQDAPFEDMVAPELVFTKSSKDQDDER